MKDMKDMYWIMPVINMLKKKNFVAFISIIVLKTVLEISIRV